MLYTWNTVIKLFTGFVVYTVCSCNTLPPFQNFSLLPSPLDPSGTHLGVTPFPPSFSFRALMYEHYVQVYSILCFIIKWNGSLVMSDIHIFTLNQDWSTPPHPHPIVFILPHSFVIFVFLVCVCVDCEVGVGSLSWLLRQDVLLTLGLSDSTLLTGQKSPATLRSLPCSAGLLAFCSLYQTYVFSMWNWDHRAGSSLTLLCYAWSVNFSF